MLNTCPPLMPFFTLKVSQPVEVSLIWLEGVVSLGGSVEEAFLWMDVLEGAGVFLLPGVVEVPLLPATLWGGRGFYHGARNCRWVVNIENRH